MYQDYKIDYKINYRRPSDDAANCARQPGYCYACGSYCYGYCDNYTPRNTSKLIADAYKQAKSSRKQTQ